MVFFPLPIDRPANVINSFLYKMLHQGFMTYRKIVVVQFLFLSGVGVGSLLAAEGWYNIDESPVVLDTALSTASLLLLLFLLVNLGGLMLDLTGTSERTVHLTYVKKSTWKPTMSTCQKLHNKKTKNEEQFCGKRIENHLRARALWHQWWLMWEWRCCTHHQEEHQPRTASIRWLEGFPKQQFGTV